MRNKRVLGLLEKAYNTIKSHKRWCDGSVAVDKYKNTVDVKDKCAVAYCATGSLELHSQGPGSSTYDDSVYYLNDVSEQLFGQTKNAYDIITVNDNLGHKATLKVFQTAIKQLKKKLSGKLSKV